ncbi:MAG: sigma 54-interacting transcriptional regulator, partial [Spirochaetia bacterium]
SDELLPATPAFDEIIHSSEIMERTVNMARRVSFFDVPVLLLGESGTGKELFARAIHNSSQRGGGPFISVNCGALPESLVESELFGYVKGAFTGAGGDKKGYIESADGGTLFLDEIGELPLHVQVLLLRVLQDGKFRRIGSTKDISSDFRLISATNRPLTRARTDREAFRDDLFHRIAVGVIKIPPLRERDKDIRQLTDFFLDSLNEEFSRVEGYRPKRMSIDTRRVISQYSWPGNVRELINTLTRACLWSPNEQVDAGLMEQSLIRRGEGESQAGTEEVSAPGTSGIEPKDVVAPEEQKTDTKKAASPEARKTGPAILHRPIGEGFDIDELIDEVKRHYLRRAMDEAGGSKVKAARLLGMSNYQTLSNWLDKYGEEECIKNEHNGKSR